MLLYPVRCTLMNSVVSTLHAKICDCIPCRTTIMPSIKEPVKLMQIIGLAIEVPSRNSLSKDCGRCVHNYLIIQLLTLHRKAIVPIPLLFSLAVFHSPIIYDFIPKLFPLYNSCNIYTRISSVVTRAFVVILLLVFCQNSWFSLLWFDVYDLSHIYFPFFFCGHRRTLFAEFCKNPHASCHLYPPRYSIWLLRPVPLLHS